MPSSGRPSQVSSSPCWTRIRSLFGLSARRALLVVGGLVVVAVRQAHRRQDAMHVAVVVVQRQGGAELGHHPVPGGLAVRAPVVDPGLAEHAGLPGMGVGIVGVERQGAVEQKLRLGIVGRGRAVVQHLAGEHALVGHHVGGGLAVGALVGGGLDPAGQGGRDGGGDLVLDGEDVGELAVVALGPDVAVGRGVDQLDGDAHPVAGLAHAALDHVLDAELARHLLARAPACPCGRRPSCARSPAGRESATAR